VVSTGTRGPILDDTIVALSTAAGPGLRAIVRMSGPKVAPILRAVLPDFHADPILKRQIIATDIALAGVAGRLPVDLFFLRGPTTYTGQDLAELHSISSPPLVELLLSRLLQAGARGASPGEFTIRAFLAGKFDLTRAEAVHAVVEAATPEQLRTALTQLAGGMARPIDQLRTELLDLLAEVEASLDFADEDLLFAESTALLNRLTKAMAQITLVLKQITGRATHDRPVRVVLAGPPNAGKSSLFNVLVGRDAAIVSPQAGTTRDYLEADLTLGDRTVRIVDTAGLGRSSGSLDAEAQALGRQQAEEAEVVLCCRERGLLGGGDGPVEAIRVGTKSDLGPVAHGWLPVSVTTGMGLDALRSVLQERVLALAVDPSAASLARCRGHVEATLEHLRHAHAVVLQQEPAELLALQIRLALDEVGAIVGAVYTDDLLDRIFGKFCIGK
jgi:tRNA modification GTPase